MDIARDLLMRQNFRYDKQLETKDATVLRGIVRVAPSEKKYTINDILDRVETGDLSILKELNIPFTEITDEQGNQKISFKYDNVRYTVNLVNSPSDTRAGEDSGEVDDTDNSEGGEKTIEGLYAQKEECLKKLDEIASTISSLHAPTPPYPNDYMLYNGSLDEQAYNEAMKNYKNAMTEYEQQINELNREAIETSSQLQVLEAEIAELELKQKTDELQDEIDALKDSPNANQDLINALEKQLEFVKASGTNSYIKTMLIKQQADVCLALSNLRVPTPPNVNDYRLSDGTVDEYAYSEAMSKYENELHEYDMQKQQLESNLSIINNELRKVEIEEKALPADSDKLEKNINAAKNIQSMLDSTPESPENEWLIARLRGMLAELANNVEIQTKVMQHMSALQNEMNNTEPPTPPQIQDFIKNEYSFEIDSNQYTIRHLEQNGDGTYFAFLDDGSVIRCQPIFDKNNKNITDLIIIQPDGKAVKVNVTAEGIVDEAAYSRAKDQWHRQIYEYEHKISNLNRQIESDYEVLSNLESRVALLNFNSCASTLDNKISELRANGNYEEAEFFNDRLNDMRREFYKMQHIKQDLLNRQQNLNNSLNSLVPPRCPQVIDYRNADGTINENAYKNAYNQYQWELNEYDASKAKIDNLLKKIQEGLNYVNERESALQNEIESLVK